MFRSGYHALLMVEGREEIQLQHTEEYEIALGDTRATASKTDAQRMGKIHRTGAWLSMLPSTVNGTELGAQEWRDFLFLGYGIDPPDLTDHYNEYRAEFSICHALDCKNKGRTDKTRNLKKIPNFVLMEPFDVVYT